MNGTGSSLAYEVDRVVSGRDVDRLDVVRTPAVLDPQRRDRSRADRPVPFAWWIGLGHGVDDYGFPGSVVIPGVREVQARPLPPELSFTRGLCNVPVRATLGMLWSVSRRMITAPDDHGPQGNRLARA